MNTEQTDASIKDRVDFTDLDIFATGGVPHAMLTELRSEEPVYWHANTDGSGFWLVTRHEDVVRISRDWKSFSSDMANGGVIGLTARERQVRDGNASENSLITMDPPIHSKYRQFVSNAMLPSAVAELADRIRQISIAKIDAALNKPVFDFIDEIAAWIPLEALAELGNIPMTDRTQMFRWVNAIVAPEDTEFASSLEEAFRAQKALQAYCIELYRSRSQNPGNDIISMMIKGEIEGEAVTAERACSFFELLLAAGSETTRTVMTHGILALARFPDQYKIMQQNPEIVKSTAVEEILRWASPVIYFRRGATADYELRGKQIKAGDAVVICYASANRDESVFKDPFVFDVRRHPNPHLTFGGRGPHNCLGTNLARMELRIFFEELCQRVSEVKVMGEPSRLRSNLTNGIKHLPLNFVPV